MTTDDDVLSTDQLRKVEDDDLSLLFLEALDEHGGSASTREIRDYTQMEVTEAHYRYEKLGDLDLISISYDNSRTAQGVSAMKVAELTDAGQYIVDEDYTEDATREPTTDELVEEAHSQAAENRDEIESMYGWAADMDARINALTTVFDALGLDEETWEDVVMLHHPDKDLDADEEQLKEFIREEMAGLTDEEEEEGNGSPWIAATADD